jgi:hypothetical protein
VLGEVAKHACFDVEAGSRGSVELDGDGRRRGVEGEVRAVDLADTAAGEGAYIAEGAECGFDRAGGIRAEHGRR